MYAKQKLFLLMWRRLFSPCLLLPFVLLAFSQPTLADSAEDAARSLAHKVSAIRKNSDDRYHWENRSSISSTASERLREAFEAEMERFGVPLEVDSSAELSILITEDPASLHLIAYSSADFRDNEKNELIASVTFSKGQSTLFEDAEGPLRLDRQLLWEQLQPILDLAQSKDPAGKPDVFVVLGHETLSLYRWNDEQWQLKDTVALPWTKHYQRGLVGEIHLYDHFFQFHLPGIECDGDGWQKLTFECDEELGIWGSENLPLIPFSLDSGHNFFAVNPHYIGPKSFALPSFFSMTQWLSDSGSSDHVALAGADGHAYVYSPGNESDKVPESLERLTTDWGSNVASPHYCGDNIVLATSAKDHASRDTLQGFKIEGSAVNPVTAALDFPGPILNLKPFNDSYEDVLLAIVSNLTTGKYEAYRVTVVCRE